jgi:hypothetical protein
VDYEALCGSSSRAQLKGACRAKGLPVGGTKAVLRARLEAAAAPPQAARLRQEALQVGLHQGGAAAQEQQSLFVVLVERKSCCGTANGDIAGGGTATGGAGRGTAG